MCSLGGLVSCLGGSCTREHVAALASFSAAAVVVASHCIWLSHHLSNQYKVLGLKDFTLKTLRLKIDAEA